jgi:hypothetical protein
MAGRKTSWPVEEAAEKTPVTSPRRVWNQRFATMEPSTSAIAPVPTPTSRPQRIHSCHGAVIQMVNPEPRLTRTNATDRTRRMPKRSMRAAANGAVTPKSTRLTVTAPEVVVLDQPNVASNGSISAPVEDRKPAAAMSADTTAAATNQARWTPERRGADSVALWCPVPSPGGAPGGAPGRMLMAS